MPGLLVSNHYPEGEDPSNEIPGTGTVNNPG